MQKLVLDSALGHQLAQAADGLELCDQSGHTIGYFIPADEPTPEEIACFESQVTDEELQRARAEPDGPTTAEVLQRLASL